jgi:predicted transcriptional regulator
LGKNRDQLSIVAAILEAARIDTSKTRIMFAANLSFSLLEKYLSIALKYEFVRVENNRYSLTEHGREFLKQYRNFEDRYLRAQKVLESLSSEREQLTQHTKQPKLVQIVKSAKNVNRVS